MRHILAATLICAPLLAGCAAISAGANGVVSFVDSPATQQAVGTVTKLAKALICDVSAGGALAASIEQQVQARAGAQSTTGMIAVASASVCTAMGGSLTGASARNIVGVSAPAVAK